MNVCRKKKIGFRKFGNTCRYQHIDTVCEDSKCENEISERRHPKKFTYFVRFSRYKFREFCKYCHVTLYENDDKGIKKLELEKNDLKIENNKIKKEIEFMKINISNTRIYWRYAPINPSPCGGVGCLGLQPTHPCCL